jgi:hypothetical protein
MADESGRREMGLREPAIVEAKLRFFESTATRCLSLVRARSARVRTR